MPRYNISDPERARALQTRGAARRRARVILDHLGRGPLYPEDRDRIITAARSVPDVDTAAPLDRQGVA